METVRNYFTRHPRLKAQNIDAYSCKKKKKIAVAQLQCVLGINLLPALPAK